MQILDVGAGALPRSITLTSKNARYIIMTGTYNFLVVQLLFDIIFSMKITVIQFDNEELFPNHFVIWIFGKGQGDVRGQTGGGEMILGASGLFF